MYRPITLCIFNAKIVYSLFTKTILTPLYIIIYEPLVSVSILSNRHQQLINSSAFKITDIITLRNVCYNID